MTTQGRALKQPPSGYKLLLAGETIQSGDISRSPITDSWGPVAVETHGHVVNNLNARGNIFARAA
jgi:hypothetical protein